MGSIWRYSIAFSIPASIAWALACRGLWSPFAVLFAFGLLPILDFLLPVSEQNPSPEQELIDQNHVAFDYLLRSMVPIQFGLLMWFLNLVEDSSLSTLERIGITWSMGIGCGVMGINVAHELGHRKSPLDQWLARALLSTSLYWQFFISHNQGHHRNVATPKDPESAHRNETIYAFWVRAIHDTFIESITLAPHQMRMGIAIQLGMIWLIASVFGVIPCLCFLMSATIGILLLQSVNYIEHYGLERKTLPQGGFERVLPEHSWNSSHPLSRAVLFELSRHSDHHANVTRPYQILRHDPTSPQLPAGYPVMILLALCPPLWFQWMNPKVDQTKGKAIKRSA
jgi:alkane 1-monooxygenase